MDVHQLDICCWLLNWLPHRRTGDAVIFVKVEKQSRAKKPRPQYLMGDGWPEIYHKLETQASAHPHMHDPWHTVKLHTISEAEFNKHTHPGLF